MASPVSWNGAPPASVSAVINYSFDGGFRPQIDNDDYTKNAFSLKPAEMTILNGDRLDVAPRLDAEGFACLPHKGVPDIEVQESIHAYRDAMGPYMKALTGADEIIMLPFSPIRVQARDDCEFERPPPADFVHSDYTPPGVHQVAPMYLSQPMSADTAPVRPEAKRHALFNMWKLLSPGPTNRPLALCDYRSITPQDIIPGDSRFPSLDGFAFETAFFKCNPAHRWVYFPELTSDRILIFKQGDSDAAFPRMVPHTAFTDTACPAGAAPRISIESRCIALWH